MRERGRGVDELSRLSLPPFIPRPLYRCLRATWNMKHDAWRARSGRAIWDRLNLILTTHFSQLDTNETKHLWLSLPLSVEKAVRVSLRASERARAQNAFSLFQQRNTQSEYFEYRPATEQRQSELFPSIQPLIPWCCCICHALIWRVDRSGGGFVRNVRIFDNGSLLI